MAENNTVGETMSAHKLQELLQTTRVDVGNGTLFGVSNKRDPGKKKLTLVISSGGSGKSSILQAMSIADQKLTEEYKTYVKFIVVDSSTDEISPFEKMDQSFVKSLNISSPGAKDRFNRQVRPSFFKEIMPADYDVHGLLNDHGAAQDRMTGRIKLYDVAGGEGNDTKLANLIKGFFDREWQSLKEYPVDIILLSGISGGNGSGTFIDLAVIARNACPNGASVYGYLMLPDTAEGFAKGDHAKGTLYRNGFAALKELESYMSLSFEPERKEIFKTTRAGEVIEVSAMNPPFDYPVLISGNYDDAVSMIGETIVNLIADSEGGFDQKAFYSNLVPMKTNALNSAAVSDLGILKNGACPEDSHMYCGIGYAHASIPEKIVIPNVIGKVNQQLYVAGQELGMQTEDMSEAFVNEDKPLTTAQFEKAMRTLFGLEGALDSGSLWQKIDLIMGQFGMLDENEYAVTKSDIMSDNVQDYLDGFHVADKSLEAEEGMMNELKRLEAEFRTNAAHVMETYGPRALHYLYIGQGYFKEGGGWEDLSSISIKKMLEKVQTELQKMASTPGVYPPRVERKGMIREIIEFFTKGDVNEWMGQAADAAQQDVFCALAKKLNGGTWKQEYANRVVTFLNCCERFADVLDVMSDHYESAGKVMDQGYEKFSADTGEKNGINLCRSQKMYEWVKEKVNEKIAGVNIKLVKSDLIQDFIAHIDEWVSDTPGVARKRYDEVMSKTCQIGKYASVGSGLHLSVADYFTEVLDGVTDVNEQITRIKNELTDIISSLRQASAPSLKVEKSNAIHINENFLVPKELFAGPLGQSISNAFTTTVGDPKKIHASSVVDAIVCYQTSVANPLSGLKDLTLWEVGYEKNFGSDNSSTCHSVNGEFVTEYTELTGTETDEERNQQLTSDDIGIEDNRIAGTGLSWKHYPSVNTKIYADNFEVPTVGSIGKTFESAYRSEVFNSKIEYALREGIIECVKDGNKYSYFLNTIPEDWTNLNAANYITDSKNLEKGKFRRGQKLFEVLASQNPHSTYKWRKEIKLLGSAFFQAPFDFTEILRKEHWKPERVTSTHKTYMKRIMRKNISLYRALEETLYRYYSIRRELEESELQYKEVYQMALFVELYQYGLLYSDVKGQVWNVRINEIGANKQIVEFNQKLKAVLKGADSGIVTDRLNFALVFRRFVQLVSNGELDLDELEVLKDNVIEGMEEEEFIAVRDKNRDKLREFYQIYHEKYGREKDVAKAMNAAWNIRTNDRSDADQVIKLYEEISSQLDLDLDELGSGSVHTETGTAAVVTNTDVAAGGWDCPACGSHHADDVMFCPKDGTKKPEPVQEGGWDCPNCGSHHADDVMFCPKDGTKKPEPAQEGGWDCPSCGAHHADTVMFCPNDGTRKPEPKQESGWDCPSCGTHHADTVMFCPNDGTRRPESATVVPTFWICPSCGTKHDNAVMFCPNDGQRRPDAQAQAAPTSWICPSCGTKHDNAVMFCPNDGQKNPNK